MHLPRVSPQVFSLSAVAVGVLLVDNASPNETNALGNWLMLVAQYLCTDATYGQLLQSRSQTPGTFKENNTANNNPSNKNTEETMQMLIKMVNALNEEINELKKQI